MSTLEIPHGKDPAWERIEALEKQVTALDHTLGDHDERISHRWASEKDLLNTVMSRIYGIEAKIRELHDLTLHLKEPT